jgi:hypothetical protein
VSKQGQGAARVSQPLVTFSFSLPLAPFSPSSLPPSSPLARPWIPPSKILRLSLSVCSRATESPVAATLCLLASNPAEEGCAYSAIARSSLFPRSTWTREDLFYTGRDSPPRLVPEDPHLCRPISTFFLLHTPDNEAAAKSSRGRMPDNTLTLDKEMDKHTCLTLRWLRLECTGFGLAQTVQLVISRVDGYLNPNFVGLLLLVLL